MSVAMLHGMTNNRKSLRPVVDLFHLSDPPLKVSKVRLDFIVLGFVGLLELEGGFEMRRPTQRCKGLFMFQRVEEGAFWLSNGSKLLQLIPYGDTLFWRWVEAER